MNWMKLKWVYFLISALIIIPGIYSLIKFGLKSSIDFTGGAIVELRFDKEIKTLGDEEIKNEIKNSGLTDFSIQTSGEKTILIRAKLISKEEVAKMEQKLFDKFNEKPQEIRFETVGPTLGKELLKKTIVAIVLASLFILLYVGRQFKDLKFGVCAILAMFHDTLVLLGSFSLLGHFFGVEVDTLFVTAVLTILSFSVHDTVVVYDRIRESQKIYPNNSLDDLVNKAITETISRSLNNSLTIIFMLIALWLLGGATIKWFTVALLIGTISGTYSSTFTAAPLLVVWENLAKRRKK